MSLPASRFRSRPCACACAYACAWVCECVGACVCAYACGCAWVRVRGPRQVDIPSNQSIVSLFATTGVNPDTEVPALPYVQEQFKVCSFVNACCGCPHAAVVSSTA